MKGKQNAKANPITEGTPSLAQLLSDSDDNSQFDYDRIDWPAFGSLAVACCRLGALVSLYLSSSDNSIVVSIRFGSERRAFGYTDAQQFNNGVVAVAKKLGAYSKGRNDL